MLKKSSADSGTKLLNKLFPRDIHNREVMEALDAGVSGSLWVFLF